MPMQSDVEVRLVDGDHVVHFYDSDEQLARVVARSASEALAAGATAVLIVSEAHLADFSTALAGLGVDVASSRAEGRLVLRDAAATLAGFMVDGAPDPLRFRATVGELVRRGNAGGRSVWAFGEMVALLWESGNVTGAMQLEDQWNALFADRSFSLFCAYPARLFDGADAETAHADVCRVHSGVVAVGSEDAERSRGFTATVDAPRAARRFAAETLADWACPDLLDDCLLIVTELASNAVTHTGSPFTVTLARGDGCIAIRVADGSCQPPARRGVEGLASDGRGLHLIEAMAYRWGHEPAAGGKVVWAEVCR
ncbi:MAG TPA: MEDS domain-containing protein [Acidimicrobiia bacterium]|nr:MEDS domain-containing protein [Acidimicrobiia bacterium]